MKIIGTAGRGYLAEISDDEIAILLGFRSTYDDAYKAWLREKNRGETTLPVGTEVTIKSIGEFWQSILWREEEAKKGAATLRALADLITTNLPSGLHVPKPVPTIVEVHGET